MDPTTLAGTGFVILGVVVWAVCAYLCWQRAPSMGRRAGTWAVLGIIFGPFALMALVVLPKGDHVTPHEKKKTDPRDDLYEVHKKH